MSLRNIELKIIANHESGKTVADIKPWLEQLFNSPLQYHTLEVNFNGNDPSSIISWLESAYDCSARTGVSGGCYGARDGKHYDGLTVWLHPKHLTDRYIDSEYGEQVNPWSLLNDHGELVECDDVEKFLELAESLGLTVNSFDVIENMNDDSAAVYLAVMFHYGGDIRGNYTDKVLFKFSSKDDIYSVIYPTKQLSDDEAV